MATPARRIAAEVLMRVAQDGAFANRALEELDAPVRVALRLGAFELLHHGKVPPHAAVNEAVELAKELKAGRAAGFVNAVLRKLAETRAPPPPPSREVDPVGHVAALTAHPRWMIESWSRWLGPSEAEKLSEANQHQAAATVRGGRRRGPPQQPP